MRAVLTALSPGGQLRWEALGLSRSTKGGVFAAALLALLGASGWGTRAAIVLLGALVVRCNLKPSEARAAASKHSSVPHAVLHNTSAEPVLARCTLSVTLQGTRGRQGLHGSTPHCPDMRVLPQVDAISSRAQPLVLSARKRARRVSDFVRRRSSLCVPPLGKLHER